MNTSERPKLSSTAIIILSFAASILFVAYAFAMGFLLLLVLARQ